MTAPSFGDVDWNDVRHRRLLAEYRKLRQQQDFIDDEYQRALVAAALARLTVFEERYGLPATEAGAA